LLWEIKHHQGNKEKVRMEKKLAPFTKDEVESLKMYQNHLEAHPFTCGSFACDRSTRPDAGKLIPSEEGWVCPCGKYKQNWCHDFMLTLPGGFIVGEEKDFSNQ
jgi:hypothetical protein